MEIVPFEKMSRAKYTLQTTKNDPPMGAELRFVRPSQDLAASFVDLRDAFTAHGEDEWIGQDAVAHRDPAAYIDLLLGWSAGVNLPEGWGPADVYWILLGDAVVGHCDVRHPLTPRLERVGGHIGYHVHPDYRNRGIATFALREGLAALAAKGVTEALVTCSHDNAASIRVIEKCGGVRIADSTRRRYRIPISLQSSSGGAKAASACTDGTK
jgi:predicted acetyltransferase